MILALLSIAGGLAMWAHERRERREHPQNFLPPPQFSFKYGLDYATVFARAQRYLLEPALTPAAVAAVAPEHVYFKPGEPQTFAEFDGQPHIVEYLAAAVRGLADEEQAIRPQLFLGMAGMGKTLLAKVVANELQERAARLGQPMPLFIEAFPADMPDVASLDELMRRVQQNPGSVVFIDEIHDLQGSHSLKLYLVLEEGRYQFHGDPQPTRLPPVTLLGATTDYGLLHPALKRRWIKHFFKPASEAELLSYLARQPFPSDPSAAQLIVDRTKFSGAPWEALELYEMAVTLAKGHGADIASPADVEEAFELQEIDELGLRWIDRRVIEALLTQPKYRRIGEEQELVCFASGELNTCTLAGVDKAEYRETIRPRLMSRGLLTVRPYYGQALTARAVARYCRVSA